MNVLYLCPNFPPNYYRFPVELQKAGATVVGIGWEAYDRLRPEIKEALTEYCQVEDMANYDHVLRAAAHLISRVGKLDRVVSQEEHWLDLEASLRLDFNVPGRKPDESRPFRLKSSMKEVFRRAKVPVADGEVVPDLEAALRFTKRVGFPVIAKPDKGVGAAGTHKLSSEAEVEAFFSRKSPDIPYIFEEFLEGPTQTFDGLLDKEGHIVFCTSHQYSNDIMTVVNEDDHVHYWSLREIPKDLEKLGRRTIAAFGLRERFFHLEFIRHPKRGLTAMEINARPPGGLTTDMFNFANEIDVYKEWANVVVHGRFEAVTERPYFICYIGRKAKKRYKHSHEEVLRDHSEAIIHHTPIDSVFRRALGDYAYLARAEKLEDLWPIVAYVHELQS